jgi:acyl carrier protein
VIRRWARRHEGHEDELDAQGWTGVATTWLERAVSDVDERIRAVLDAHGRLPVSAATLKDGDDLYQRGLSSHASVNVMLALEDAFDVEFPDSLLRRDTFRSVEAIRGALESLGVVVAQG